MDNRYTDITGESDHVLAWWIHETSPNLQQRVITQGYYILVWTYDFRKAGNM